MNTLSFWPAFHSSATSHANSEVGWSQSEGEVGLEGETNVRACGDDFNAFKAFEASVGVGDEAVGAVKGDGELGAGGGV